MEAINLNKAIFKIPKFVAVFTVTKPRNKKPTLFVGDEVIYLSTVFGEFYCERTNHSYDFSSKDLEFKEYRQSND